MPIVSDLIRSGMAAFIVKAIGAGLAFTVNIVIAQMTDSATYGVFVFTLGWVGLAALGARLGLETLVMRLVASYRSEPEHIPAVTRWAYRRLALQITGTLIVAAIALFTMSPLLSQVQTSTLLFAAPLLIVMSWNSITQSILQGLGKATAFVPEHVIRPGLFLLLLGLWALHNPFSPTSVELILTSALAAAVALSVSLIWSRRLTGTGGEFNSEAIKTWRRGLTPLLLITGASVLFSQTDVLLLGILDEDTSVGIYAAASRIVVLVTFVLTAVNTVLAPMIANLWTTKESGKLQTLVTAGARVSFGTAVILSSVLWLGAEPVLSLFGPDFVAAAPALRILLAGHVINAFVGAAGIVQLMTGYERPAALFMVIAGAINILLNLLLIPHYGIVGAAAGTACAIALTNICCAVFVQLKLGIRSTPI